MFIGACTLKLYLPGSASLKEKRSRLRPLLARLRKEFDIAAAEVELQDVWQSAALGLVAVSNEAAAVDSHLRHVVSWVERHYPEVQVEDARFEILVSN